MTDIGNYAFCLCSRLASIEIPSSVTSIADGVFYGCSSLTSVEIPSSVTSIGSSAFEDCHRCNRLPVCMGLCPRDYMSGFSHCKYEVMDENFEVSLLDYLQHQLG
mgnify:CR=1 FL=1